MANLKAILMNLVNDLNVLKEREAKYGGNAPLELINQIRDHHKAINLVEEAIESKLSQQELQRELRTLLISTKEHFGAINGITPDIEVRYARLACQKEDIGFFWLAHLELYMMTFSRSRAIIPLSDFEFVVELPEISYKLKLNKLSFSSKDDLKRVRLTRAEVSVLHFGAFDIDALGESLEDINIYSAQTAIISLSIPLAHRKKAIQADVTLTPTLLHNDEILRFVYNQKRI